MRKLNSNGFWEVYSQAGIDTGWVEVSRFDPENRIVSGRFEFTATDTDEEDNMGTFHVTEGRFDCTFY